MWLPGPEGGFQNVAPTGVRGRELGGGVRVCSDEAQYVDMTQYYVAFRKRVVREDLPMPGKFKDTVLNGGESTFPSRIVPVK